MRSLLTGQLERGAYTTLIANLHPVYSALEAGLTRRRGHPLVAPAYHPELFREAALERDLETRGQILKGMVQAQLGGDGGAATAFYDFPDVADPESFKRAYRAALPGLAAETCAWQPTLASCQTVAAPGTIQTILTDLLQGVPRVSGPPLRLPPAGPKPGLLAPRRGHPGPRHRRQRDHCHAAQHDLLPAAAGA